MNSNIGKAILDNGFSGEIDEFANVGELTTMKIGGKARLVAYPANELDLLLLAEFIKETNVRYFILGGGSNTIFKDEIYDGIVVHLAAMNDISILSDGTIQAEGGCPLHKVISFSHEKGFTGMEGLIGIPGSVGGAVMSNAGAFGYSIGEFVKELEVIRWDGKRIVLKEDDFAFSYRTFSFKDTTPFVISRVKLKFERGNVKEAQEKMKVFQRERQLKQPLDMHSAGSIFKNPPGMHAGKLIEACGLKGKRIGALGISTKHANFIVNFGGGTRRDFDELTSLVIEEVLKKFGVRLELEVVCVG